jgi:hypothetical protein
VKHRVGLMQDLLLTDGSGGTLQSLKSAASGLFAAMNAFCTAHACFSSSINSNLQPSLANEYGHP